MPLFLWNTQKLDQTETYDLQIKTPNDSEEALAFEDLFLPIIQVARQKLLIYLKSSNLSCYHSRLELLSESAYLAIEHRLLSQLVNLCEKTLEFEFSHFRPFKYNLLNLLGVEADFSDEKTHYQAFVQQNLQDGLLAFFRKYPVLGRLIATQIDFWVESTAEFLQRLQKDIIDISKLFQVQQNNKEFTNFLGKVTKVSPNLSDRHNQGSCVIALTFESGLKLIYKPKNMGLQVAYNELLDWCNQRKVFLPFKILKVLERQDYGWIEYVEQTPCLSKEAAQNFYKRAGMLLCLIYALGGNDCHCENLIASGEYPVLVDVETLLHPDVKQVENDVEKADLPLISQQLFDTVVNTGLLPCWELSPDKRTAYDISGFGNLEQQELLSRILQWKDINTDKMHQRYENVMMPAEKNIPFLKEMSLSPNDYLGELVEGFQQMYHFLVEQRQNLLADSAPLRKLQEQQVRFLFRNTKVYNTILKNTFIPKLLQNGIDWSIELDILARAFLITQNKPKDWSIYHSELAQMLQLDIPYFIACSNSDDLTIKLDKPIKGYFKEPSYGQVISRLQKLNKIDLNLQVSIIQGTFSAMIANLSANEYSETEKKLTLDSVDYSNCNVQDQLLSKAQDIASEICANAIQIENSGITWLGFSYLPSVNRFQLKFSDKDFYEGNCGIALFLAALDYVNKKSQFRDLVLEALQYTRRVVQICDSELAHKFVKIIGVGGATGIGSIIYSLVRISNFIREPELVEDALKFSALITPEIIAADRKLDVIDGTAGTILALLALYRETNNITVLEKAIACGKHLLNHQISIDGLPKAWKTNENQPLTGFSHGAAGISYALLRLYAVTDDVAYLEAAQEGIAYENKFFSSDSKNWSDLRSIALENGQPGFPVSWCHGAVGIALARLGGISTLATDEIYQNIEIALETIQKSTLHSVDHLCCGNLGQCEALLVAAQKLSRPELFKMAQQKIAGVIHRAEKNRGYKLFANLPTQVLNPGFFQGTPGIGYEFLRLAYPEALPSVLLWE
ncbi:type 2 lantibiotic biosynthesis protein [Dulcicalothrix desertica PCC 7102]|uniref:Type 2 lantibiotic biosynthesis protein n=1 Tax=Dulcicalothrix desertica PCC 7102 TaxID=232991 RepID=A0A3S1CPJ5_9CYAN|nr:type 2 lanthipeptide synthetase LanM family protein [Dulcicalothrix desertica]RUT06003.1 type 2 lantibiotic biosynthesis protein [Dulcicalothrix desertica PCC 7102]TWH54331.1 type 2 lantibiotic biosynthesis protein LanM [Dulcicalothrix desertica PCC 7102]